MYNQRYEDIGKPEIIRRIDIFDYVRAFVWELSKLEQSIIKFNDDFNASRVKGLMNLPQNTTFKSLTDMRNGQPYWKHQDVDYVQSNLGNGKESFSILFVVDAIVELNIYIFIQNLNRRFVANVANFLTGNQAIKKGS